MKLTPDFVSALNEQITLELEASVVYRQLAIEMTLRDLPGMSAWLRHQADEEIVHANKFIDHVADRGDHPRIGAIAAPDVTVESVLDCFRAALAHEEKVSASIRDLVRIADKHDDFDARPLLHWFLAEQIDEEATVREIIGRLELIDGHGPGLLRLDAELGQRRTGDTEVPTD